MKSLQRELGLTYLFISHDLSVIRYMADEIGVLYLGRLVEVADRDTLFDKPRHPYTRMLMDAAPHIDAFGRTAEIVKGGNPRSDQQAERLQLPSKMRADGRHLPPGPSRGPGIRRGKKQGSPVTCAPTSPTGHVRNGGLIAGLDPPQSGSATAFFCL